MPRIPKILHYCFFYDRSFGGKPWSLVNFVCVKSALERIRPDQAFIYYEHEPSSVWWDETCKLLTPIKIQAPRQIFGNALNHPAHRADVVRLETLLQHGGIYLDADVFVHEGFDTLLDNSVVLGEEGVNAQWGLANAVILAEPNAPFLKRWYEEYRSFRSMGHDEYWAEHSVRVPSALAKAYPDELTILPRTAFYWPGWEDEGLKWIYDSPPPFDTRGTFANHLWESAIWENYLEHLTPAKVRTIDSNFHRWVRPFIENLPDEYGSPSLLDKCKHFLRIEKRHVRSKIDLLNIKLERARRRGLIGAVVHATDKLVSERRYRRRVFSEIYKWKLWGDDNDKSIFYSGTGSRGAAAAIYIEHMSKLLNRYASALGTTITVVDLGCGDFLIGRELVDQVSCMRYIGCDIVPELIDHHTNANVDKRVQFKVVDIVTDEIPDGDVCLIRQVLQYLSNADIKKVLLKLYKFDKVIITESYPVKGEGPVNPDKLTNHEVRFNWRTGYGRGVELDKEPYCVPTRELFQISPDEKQVLITFDVNCSAFSKLANRDIAPAI